MLNVDAMIAWLDTDPSVKINKLDFFYSIMSNYKENIYVFHPSITNLWGLIPRLDIGNNKAIISRKDFKRLRHYCIIKSKENGCTRDLNEFIHEKNMIFFENLKRQLDKGV